MLIPAQPWRGRPPQAQSRPSRQECYGSRRPSPQPWTREPLSVWPKTPPSPSPLSWAMPWPFTGAQSHWPKSMRTPPLGNPKALGEKKSQMTAGMGDHSCQGEKCPQVMSAHTGLHRSPLDHNESLMHSLWSFQPQLTTQSSEVPAAAQCAGTGQGVSVSHQPSKLPYHSSGI